MLLRGYQLSVGVLKIIFFLLSLLQTSKNPIQIHVYPHLKAIPTGNLFNIGWPGIGKCPTQSLVLIEYCTLFFFFGGGGGEAGDLRKDGPTERRGLKTGILRYCDKSLLLSWKENTIWCKHLKVNLFRRTKIR